MKYCTNCLYPSTKPDLWFDDQGLCSACIAFNDRKNIDWKQREKEFIELVRHIKSMKFDYDCIVPVSGGKDSHYQVIKCLEYDLKILAVTATTCDLTPIGRRNLDNIAKLGVDHIEITPDRELRKKINKFALMEVGDISWPEHQLIFTIPFRVAMQMGIPYIFYGESPQNEYGGPSGRQDKKELDKNWLQEFGGLNGLRVSDLPFEKNKLTLYKMPIAGIVRNPEARFMGYYFEWDGYANSHTAIKYGFETWDYPVEGCGFAYENLDNYHTSIHDYFKYIKYGFGRCTDLVNNHIRREYMSREAGKERILKWDGQYESYLGEDIYTILKRIDVTRAEYTNIVNQFTNKDLFYTNKNDLPQPKFLGDLKKA